MEPRSASRWDGLRPRWVKARWVAHESHEAPGLPHLAPAGPPREASRVAGSSGMVVLDGSSGEGGGQVLRTALTLSLLTGRPFRIDRVRANRDKPGLRPQHLTAVEAAQALGGAEVEGAAIGAATLRFAPSPYVPRDMHVDIGTAGSTALVLQTLHLPIALRCEGPVRLTLAGGTFNLAAPSYPFLDASWRRWMAELGLPIALAMPAAGFYPPGGGRLDAWIEPGTLRPIHAVERPPLARIRGQAGVNRLDRKIAERMRERTLDRLADHGLDADIDLVEWTGPAPGAAMNLTAEHGERACGFVGLGARGKPAEAVADEAVDALLAFERSGAAVEPRLADQLMLPAALAPGRSEYTVGAVTGHLRTNADTIAAFLDRSIAIVEPEGDHPGRVIIG